MISAPLEKIVETKKCRISGKEFFVTDKDIGFLDRVSPVIGGKKYPFPSLDIAPIEMRKTLLSFRNQNKLYKRKCDLTGQEIISMFSAEVPFPVYEKSIWYSDDWSPKQFSKKIHFEESFFHQWESLSAIVPRHGSSRFRDINSNYCNNCADVKDCYLCFNGLYNENCLYCQIWDYSKSCIDCECIYECENCYHLSLSKKCHSCWYSHELTNCRDCILCYDCIGCTNCIGCYNMRNKNNYLFNQPSTPEAIKDYLQKQRATLLWHSSLEKVIAKGLHKYTSSVQSEDCYGNEFQASKNCFDCYYMIAAEDCKYCDHGKEQKDCHYVMNGMKNLSNAYCCQTVGINSSNLWFTINSTENLAEILYSSNIFFGVTQCFGCIGLHNHEHNCILNTSYSTQEYETLCWKIIDHMKSTSEWWQFFPRSLSPFEYNESLAQEYFPLSQEEAKEWWWTWRPEEAGQTNYQSVETLSTDQYDERIVWYDIAQKNIDSLLNGAIECEVTQKPFKITRQELAFYIENHLSLPSKHPEQRHKDRLSLRNPRQLNNRICSECQKNIITTYTADISEKIVCEECYRKLVY